MFKYLLKCLLWFPVLMGIACSAHAELTCGIDGSNNNVTAFDFNSFPSDINTSVPVGTVIYSKDYNVTVWCGKSLNAGGSILANEEIYITRANLSNLLGANSGLTVNVTINGEQGSTRKSYATGVSTNLPWANGAGDAWQSLLQRVNVAVTISLVKTGENVTLSPFRLKPALFSVGSSGGGVLTFYMANTNKLAFTTQTCQVTGDGNYAATLPSMNVSGLNVGPVSSPTADLTVKLSCNSNLWSSQKINMTLTGTTVTGLENEGVFRFTNTGDSDAAGGIALQMFQGARSGSFTPVVAGKAFLIGNFDEQLSTIDVPLRAAYYVIDSSKLTAGSVQATLIYQVDYQ